MLKMIQIAKGLVARLHTLPTDYANNVPYVAEIGDKNKLMPEVMTIIKCSTDGRICKIPIPNTKNKEVVANVVVPLLRFEESADSIQLDLATRGKNKKSISTIQSPLQFGSAYMVRCKNHINLHPDSESEKCCVKTTTQCALHCAKHQLDLNTSQKNTLILVFSYIYPTDENLRPPSPPEESWLNLLMFQEKYFSTVTKRLMSQEKYFSTVENLGDGLCLLYSISEFIRNHMDSSTPHTVTQYWNPMSNITNYETMIESKILEEMATFLGDLSDDDFTWLTEYFILEEYELKRNQKGPEL